MNSDFLPYAFAMNKWVPIGTNFREGRVNYSTLMGHNRAYRNDPKYIIHRDQVEITFAGRKDHANITGFYGGHEEFMDGIDLMLANLPQDEPLPTIPMSLCLSYFGNSAKKKLKELATPKAIMTWLKECPDEVLKHIADAVLPERKPEDVKAYREGYEAAKAEWLKRNRI